MLPWRGNQQNQEYEKFYETNDLIFQLQKNNKLAKGKKKKRKEKPF